MQINVQDKRQTNIVLDKHFLMWYLKIKVVKTMTIHERIKHLRKYELKLTQEEFAQKIKISRSNLANIESGKISITDRVCIDICATFRVNETWLREGIGDIFLEETEGEIIASFFAEVLNSESDSLMRKIILGLSKLQNRHWDMLEELLDTMFIEQKK